MESTRARVFVDTNVLFSSFYSNRGPPGKILELHSQGRIRLVVSGRVLRELARHVSRKNAAALPIVARFLSDATPEVTRDPTKEEVSAAARQVNSGGATIWASVVISAPDYFLTGDAEFLDEARRTNSGIKCSAKGICG